jgi:hypothetical protein
MHTRIILEFMEKQTNTSKETLPLSTYKMSMATKN